MPEDVKPALTDADAGSGSVLDELSLDDSKPYQQKTTKWIRNSLACVQDRDFWVILRVAHATRQPLLHFYRLLNKPPESGDVPIVALVGHQLDGIVAEFGQQLQILQSAVADCSCFDGQATVFHQECQMGVLTEVALLLLLQCAASFHRRVVQPFSRHVVWFVLFALDWLSYT